MEIQQTQYVVTDMYNYYFIFIQLLFFFFVSLFFFDDRNKCETRGDTQIFLLSLDTHTYYIHTVKKYCPLCVCVCVCFVCGQHSTTKIETLYSNTKKRKKTNKKNFYWLLHFFEIFGLIFRSLFSCCCCYFYKT